MTTWIKDDNDNKCSVEYFGGKEAAQEALDSLKGCTAAITAMAVDGQEAAKLRRLSSGFQGYDWMVSSIVKHNEIRSES